MEETGYESVEEATLHSRQSAQEEDNQSVPYSVNSQSTGTSKNLRHGGSVRTGSDYHDYTSIGSTTMPPVLEIPEEIYTIRKAALKILKPMTKTWVSGR